jgi:hypothetical protein
MSESVPNPAAMTEDAAQRIRALTEQFLDASKKGGNATLDAYERSLQNLVEFQQQAAGASQIDWVNTVAQAHAKFIQDVSAAYVSAARDMLK